MWEFSLVVSALHLVRSVECPALGGVQPLPLRGRILRQDASSRSDLHPSDRRMARVQVQTASISKVTRVFGQFLFKLAGAFHFFYHVVKSTKASLSVFVYIWFRDAQNCGSQMFARRLLSLCVFSTRCLDAGWGAVERLLVVFQVGAGQGAVACSPSPARLSSFPTLSLVPRSR